MPVITEGMLRKLDKEGQLEKIHITEKDILTPSAREFLNVNIPATTSKNFKGYAVVPAGRRTYATHATLNRNPRGIEYYWLGNAALEYEKGEPSDISKVNEGFATITPIKLNMTSYESLESLKGKFDAK